MSDERDTGHDHRHAHDHDHGGEGQDPPSDLALRVKALESLLVEKGLVDAAALDAIIDTYEHKVGPRNGARVVARAWTDAAYRQRLLTDATAAIAELGFGGRQGEHMIAVENTPKVHNLVVCTLCSCYPWPVLGLPPVWYKSSPYRSRAVIDPRGVLAEFGLELGEDVEIRVWDSTAEVRYLVVPERPAGSEHLSEEALAALVTRDSMIGVGPGPCPRRLARERGPRHGRHARPGSDRSRGRRAGVSRALGGAGPRPDPGHGAWGRWSIDASRHQRELIPGADYLAMSYYEKWLTGLIELMIKTGLVTRAEIETARPAPDAKPATPPLTAERVPPRSRGAARRAAMRPRPGASRSARRCAPAPSTRSATPACRAMRAAGPA